MNIFTILLVAAGLLHFIAFPERYKASRVVGYAYMFAGLFQITLGLFFLDINYQALYTVIAFGLSILYILIWLITLSPTIRKLGIKPEPITIHLVLRKLLELAIVIICLI